MNSTIVVDSSHITPPRVLPFMSDSALALVAPLVVYWVYSLFFHFLSKAEIPWVERYRIHDPEDMKRNKVSVQEVIRGVIFQQVLQTVLGVLVLEDESSSVATFLTTENITSVVSNILRIISVKSYIVEQFGMPAYIDVLTTISSLLQHYLIPAFQFFVAISHHHRLYVPYAFGALYNHPVEGFVMDSVGATLAFTLSGLPTRGAILFFSFSTLKTVDDHCGYAFPWDPFQFLFGNNVAYHDIHHQPFGIKKNYSQPFFTWWDRLLNTYVSTDRVYENVSAKAQIKDKIQHTEAIVNK
ncbi:hypothetical protein NQZ79_g5422 [Umbelopsis isabellina]|nr:hypothetical protein NQZ79_g5422 [Umbelopsis isabellina]